MSYITIICFLVAIYFSIRNWKSLAKITERLEQNHKGDFLKYGDAITDGESASFTSKLWYWKLIHQSKHKALDDIELSTLCVRAKYNDYFAASFFFASVVFFIFNAIYT